MRLPAGHFRHLFSTLSHDPPGERFLRHYERRRKKGEEHPVRKATLLTAGGVFLLLGLAMLVLPGPGIIFTVIGILVITARARVVAQFLDRVEIAIRSHLPARFRH